MNRTRRPTGKCFACSIVCSASVLAAALAGCFRVAGDSPPARGHGLVLEASRDVADAGADGP